MRHFILTGLLATACAGAPPPRPASPHAATPCSETQSAETQSAETAPQPEAEAPARAEASPTHAPDGRPYGSLPREHIRRRMRTIVGDMRACYQTRVLAVRPGYEGRVVSSVVIAADGSVEEVTFPEDDIGMTTMRDCMEGVLRAVRFDPPEGGGIVDFSYPWHFSIGGRASE